MSARNFLKKFHQKSAMKRERARIYKLVGSAVLLMLVGVLSTSGAAVANSTGWKKCGQVHYFQRQYLTVEAKHYGCSKALGIARGFVKASSTGNCKSNSFCEIQGFACPIEQNKSKSIVCHKASARVRLKAAPRNNRIFALTSAAGDWKKCGEFYLVTPKQPILFQTKHVPCIPALEVIAHVIVDPGIIECLNSGCEAQGFNCEHPDPPNGVLILCTHEAQQIRIRGEIHHNP